MSLADPPLFLSKPYPLAVPAAEIAPLLARVRAIRASQQAPQIESQRDSGPAAPALPLVGSGPLLAALLKPFRRTKESVADFMGDEADDA